MGNHSIRKVKKRESLRKKREQIKKMRERKRAKKENTGTTLKVDSSATTDTGANFKLSSDVFPRRDQNVKNKWIEVIRRSRNEPLWNPKSRTVVCSEHFKAEDFYFTKNGLFRVNKNVYPNILPGVPQELDHAPAVDPLQTAMPNKLSNSEPSSTSSVSQKIKTEEDPSVDIEEYVTPNQWHHPTATSPSRTAEAGQTFLDSNTLNPSVAIKNIKLEEDASIYVVVFDEFDSPDISVEQRWYRPPSPCSNQTNQTVSDQPSISFNRQLIKLEHQDTHQSEIKRWPIDAEPNVLTDTNQPSFADPLIKSESEDFHDRKMLFEPISDTSSKRQINSILCVNTAAYDLLLSKRKPAVDFPFSFTS